MEIYIYIIEKLIDDPNNKYNIITLDKNESKYKYNFIFYQCIYSNQDVSPYYFDLYNMAQSISYMYHVKKYDIVQSKFKTLNNVLDNICFSKEYKEKYFQMFSKVQKIYFSLLRFSYICKYKKSRIQVYSDLSLNPIDIKKKKIFILFQNNFRYVFLINELVHIIETAISHAPFFFVDSLQPKNPYTNIPFNLSTLYNIYFKYRETNFVFSNLFHLFFLSHFHCKNFGLYNEITLRDFSIHTYINNTPANNLHEPVLCMLKENIYTKHLSIDELFPKELLVSIMRPYLYYKYMYTHCMVNKCEKTIFYKHTLFYKLKMLYEFNPFFGRKTFNYVLKNSKIVLETEFNSKHIPFHLIETTHVSYNDILEVANIHYDSDSEEGFDSN
jgi:hypothetical protein